MVDMGSVYFQFGNFPSKRSYPNQTYPFVQKLFLSFTPDLRTFKAKRCKYSLHHFPVGCGISTIQNLCNQTAYLLASQRDLDLLQL